MHVFRHSAIVTAVVGATFVFAASAQAATLTGKGLLIDTGTGYQNAAVPLEVQPGTAVVVNPDGEGLLRYPDGCDVRVRPGEVYLVRDISPCAAGLTTMGEGFGEYGLIVGGVVVGGVVIGAIALSGGDSDKPKSP